MADPACLKPNADKQEGWFEKANKFELLIFYLANEFSLVDGND